MTETEDLIVAAVKEIRSTVGQVHMGNADTAARRIVHMVKREVEEGFSDILAETMLNLGGLEEELALVKRRLREHIEGKSSKAHPGP